MMVLLILLIGITVYLLIKLFCWCALAKVMIVYSVQKIGYITEEEFDEIFPWVMENWNSDVYKIDGYR